MTSGCRGDVVAGDAEDAPTRDSLLSLSVLKAHETILPEVEASVPTTIVVERPPAAVERPRATVQPVAAPRASPPSARRVAPASSPVRVATIASGSPLTLSAGQRICVNTSRVGDRFTARVAQGRGAIPPGARATGTVTSLTGRMGEEALAVAIRSVTVGGRTYSVSSRVTDIELDRTPGAYRCIPAGGRIEARLTRSLRIAS